MNMINQPQIRQAYTATGYKPVLSLKNVTLRYRTDASIVTAAYDVSFDVHRGDRFILLGASGCGKSSLLKAVGGFLKPVAGEIRLDGIQQIEADRGRSGQVAQRRTAGDAESVKRPAFRDRHHAIGQMIVLEGGNRLHASLAWI